MKKLLLAIATFCASLSMQAFDIVGNNPTILCIDSTENIAVKSAAEMLREDYAAVSGKQMTVGSLEMTHGERNHIIAGSVDNPSFASWLRAHGLLADDLRGRWEAFRLEVRIIDGKDMLIVTGSDKRGTAYGLLEISRRLGVSPWTWWADVTPKHQDMVTLNNDFRDSQEPSVQFRGIFINDEESFASWSKNVFEPGLPGNMTVGPKTYEQVFRLLMRLRANTIWPAMHNCSSPFFTVDGNREMAVRYGITVSTSHCEMMVRSMEWDEKKRGAFNYAVNRDKIVDYWKERVEEVAQGDNFYTLGMRGVHDLPLQGAITTQGKIAIVEQAIADQRALLKKFVNSDVTQVPQLFVPYKEVLGLYDSGLKVPDDVTLMWCNDNFGYLTHLSNAEEQKRHGGAGIYYHISYWGRPNGYLTLCSQSPALIYDQMRRAYDAQARKIWIVNVGDIKPGEFDMEFFLNMAWDIDAVTDDNIPMIMEKWYARLFGEAAGKRITPVMMEYYRLASIRKPEHMGWNRVEEDGYPKGKKPVEDCEFSAFENGDEVSRRMKAFKWMSEQVDDIQKTIADDRQDAFAELVTTPVRMAEGMNSKWLAAKMNHVYARYNIPAAEQYALLADKFTRQTEQAVRDYGKIAGGKWMDILKLWSWNRENAMPRHDMVRVDKNDDRTLFWCDHDSIPLRPSRQMTLRMIGNSMQMKVLSMNGEFTDCRVLTVPHGMRAEIRDAMVTGEKVVMMTIDDSKHRKRDKLIIQVNGRKYRFSVNYEPEDFYPIDISATTDGQKVPAVSGLGYSSSAKRLSKGQTYTFRVNTHMDGNVQLRIGMIPLQPLGSADLRYQVSIDGMVPKVISIKTDAVERDEAWKINVLRNQSITLSSWRLAAGQHLITLTPLDNGIIMDQMLLD